MALPAYVLSPLRVGGRAKPPIASGRRKSISQLAVAIRPVLPYLDKLRVSIGPDELEHPLVPVILPSVLAEETSQHGAVIAIWTFGACLQLLDTEAAHLDLASRPRHVPRPVVIAELAPLAAAQDEGATGLAVSPTATDEPDLARPAGIALASHIRQDGRNHGSSIYPRIP